MENTNDKLNTAGNVPEVNDVQAPQMQVPASTEIPNLSEEATDVAIEEGPVAPKRKNSAWLWALIGIAIVLAFIAMALAL